MDSSNRIIKIKSLNDALSPMNAKPHLNAESPLVKYFRSSRSPITSSGSSSSRISSSGSRTFTPLSAIENVTSPAVIEEDDVLVIDGILVSSDSKNSSPWHGSKTELCMAWENLGYCRYRSNCQFAHGREELCPTHASVKNKAEAHTFRAYSTRSSPSIPKSYVLPAAVTARQASSPVIPKLPITSSAIVNMSASSGKNTTPATTPEQSDRRTPTFTKPKSSYQSPTPGIRPDDSRMLATNRNTNFSFWSARDDNIEVTLPSENIRSPSREEVDAYIHKTLYEPTTRKRLPVFAEIFSEQ